MANGEAPTKCPRPLKPNPHAVRVGHPQSLCQGRGTEHLYSSRQNQTWTVTIYELAKASPLAVSSSSRIRTAFGPTPWIANSTADVTFVSCS